MTAGSEASGSLELAGLDGTNPLGFLAALGTLVTAGLAGERCARLRWTRSRTWVPVVEGLGSSDSTRLCGAIARALRGKEVSEDEEELRATRQRQFEAAKKAASDKVQEIRGRRLARAEREAAFQAELEPLVRDRAEQRALWLDALKASVPRPELALGKSINCSAAEYRAQASLLREEASHAEREALDLLAAFGSDACLERPDAIEPTPFCFIRGSGQQFFLDTVRQLLAQVDPERVRQTLFEPWAYRDEKLSMRWDPTEDRRYALMDQDPTAPGNESRTVWMANLLAYRGLSLLACAPTKRGLAATGWTLLDQERVLTWPIWDAPLPPDTIRSLLQLRELAQPEPDRQSCRARGIAAVYRARRIRVPPTGSNYKWNFSPARPL